VPLFSRPIGHRTKRPQPMEIDGGPVVTEGPTGTRERTGTRNGLAGRHHDQETPRWTGTRHSAAGSRAAGIV